MIITLVGNVDNVESYQGKNGWGATITLSNVEDKRRKTISFNTKDKDIAGTFENNLMKNVEVKINLDQNNFGLRLGNVVDVNLLK